MNTNKYTQKIQNLSSQEIELVLSEEKLQKKILRILNSDTPKQQKESYVKKIILAKISKKNNLVETIQNFNLSDKTIRILKRLQGKNLEQYNNIKKKILNTIYDESKSDISKNDRITRILQSLKNKRKSGITYTNTYNYHEILAIISEQPGITRKELRFLMQVEEKTIIRNLKKLLHERLIIKDKIGRQFTYLISRKGLLRVNYLKLSFLNRVSSCNFKDNTHFKNDSFQQKETQLLSEKIRHTKIMDKNLRDLNIYGPRVREFTDKYNLEFLRDLYNFVIREERIYNKGAYIYKVLTGCPRERRIRCFVNQRLKILGKDVCQMYRREVKDLDLQLSLRLGYSLLRLAKKVRVMPFNVHTALNNIYKEMAGTTKTGSPTQGDARSYAIRNARHEEVQQIVILKQLTQRTPCLT